MAAMRSPLARAKALADMNRRIVSELEDISESRRPALGKQKKLEAEFLRNRERAIAALENELSRTIQKEGVKGAAIHAYTLLATGYSLREALERAKSGR